MKSLVLAIVLSFLPFNLQASELKELVNELQHRLQTLNEIADYTAVLTKRERINGVLNGYEQMEVKVRHNPFSVYLRFTYPQEIAGREVVYVAGKNGNQLRVRRGGLRLPNITLDVNPFGEAAMARNRYPITQMGLSQLLNQLLLLGQEELRNPQNELEISEYSVTVGGKQCRLIQLKHTVQRRQYKFYVARIVIDLELNLPIREEVYSWDLSGNPVLEEEYTYSNLRVNVGLADRDFVLREVQ